MPSKGKVVTLKLGFEIPTVTRNFLVVPPFGFITVAVANGDVLVIYETTKIKDRVKKEGLAVLDGRKYELFSTRGQGSTFWEAYVNDKPQSDATQLVIRATSIRLELH